MSRSWTPWPSNYGMAISTKRSPSAPHGVFAAREKRICLAARYRNSTERALTRCIRASRALCWPGRPQPNPLQREPRCSAGCSMLKDGWLRKAYHQIHPFALTLTSYLRETKSRATSRESITQILGERIGHRHRNRHWLPRSAPIGCAVDATSARLCQLTVGGISPRGGRRGRCLILA